MPTLLTYFAFDLAGRGLVRELADRDDRLLLDIGLVRAADGSLRLAEDPSRPAVPKVDREVNREVDRESLRRRATAVLGGLAGLLRRRGGRRLQRRNRGLRVILGDRI
jgi:hypothetical protein